MVLYVEFIFNSDILTYDCVTYSCSISNTTVRFLVLDEDNHFELLTVIFIYN